MKLRAEMGVNMEKPDLYPGPDEKTSSPEKAKKRILFYHVRRPVWWEGFLKSTRTRLPTPYRR